MWSPLVFHPFFSVEDCALRVPAVARPAKPSERRDVKHPHVYALRLTHARHIMSVFNSNNLALSSQLIL